jgi:hypothetical protein
MLCPENHHPKDNHDSTMQHPQHMHVNKHCFHVAEVQNLQQIFAALETLQDQFLTIVHVQLQTLVTDPSWLDGSGSAFCSSSFGNVMSLNLQRKFCPHLRNPNLHQSTCL